MSEYTTMRECLLRDIHNLEDQRDFAMSEMERLERERDQWKSKFVQANKDYGFELRDPCGTIWDHAKKLQQECDNLREAIDNGQAAEAEMTCLAQTLERERDEARNAFAIATDQCVLAQAKLREAVRERDEAREEFSRVKLQWDEARSENVEDVKQN